MGQDNKRNPNTQSFVYKSVFTFMSSWDVFHPFLAWRDLTCLRWDPFIARTMFILFRNEYPPFLINVFINFLYINKRNACLFSVLMKQSTRGTWKMILPQITNILKVCAHEFTAANNSKYWKWKYWKYWKVLQAMQHYIQDIPNNFKKVDYNISSGWLLLWWKICCMNCYIITK